MAIWKEILAIVGSQLWPQKRNSPQSWFKTTATEKKFSPIHPSFPGENKMFMKGANEPSSCSLILCLLFLFPFITLFCLSKYFSLLQLDATRNLFEGRTL